MRVFPLFGDAPSVPYRLCAEVIADHTLLIEEVDEEGSVPRLLVRNKGALPVFLVEGEELVGAKQDRIVNTSLLVPAGARMEIPVSCVEHGRWVFRSNRQMASGAHPTTMVRSALKASVSRSLKENYRAVSNQAEIWDSVARLHAGHGVRSETGAMADAYEQHSKRIRDFSEQLGYPKGACGLAIAIGPRIMALDVFDRAETCERVWTRLLSGAVFDAMASPVGASTVTVEDVEALLAEADRAAWEEVRSVGDGSERRAVIAGDHASTLSCKGAMIHESIVASC